MRGEQGGRERQNYCCEWPGTICVSYPLHTKKGYLKNGLSCFQVAF